MKLLHDHWLLAHFDPTDELLACPPPGGWESARVPGTVQTSAFGLPLAELYKGKRIQEVQWMKERLWVYRRTLDVPDAGEDETVRLVFAGLDYRYEVRVDGARMVAGEGMFHPLTVPLDEMRGRRVEIEVRLLPQAISAMEMRETTKAQFTRGWDFAPELHTVGIWDEVALEVVPRLRVTEAFIETRLENRQRARVTVRAQLSETVGKAWAEITLAGSSRRVPVFDADHVTAYVEVEYPQLWWPNGLGAAAMHELAITLVADGRKTETFRQQVGLREVSRISAAGQRPTDIPLQFVINGVPLFINGVNWVPPDACVGDITDAHYDGILSKFREGNVNLIRVWGGGLCEKRRFYDQCDALGLLVFQEYPLACGLGGSEDFYRQLRREATQIAHKLRRHPSVFLFCGGNENYHYWDMLNGDSPILRDAFEKGIVAVNNGKPFENREWLAGAVKRYHEPVHVILGGVTAEAAPIASTKTLHRWKAKARCMASGPGTHASAITDTGCLRRCMITGAPPISISIQRPASPRLQTLKRSRM